MLQGVFVLVLFCSPNPPSNFLNIPTTFELLFLPQQQFSNEKFWCFETKLWSEVNFSQHVQGYAETPASFVHVTDCYCSGGKNLRYISFSSQKLSSCSKSPHFDGATLNNLGCVYLTEVHAQWSSYFCIFKREVVVV